MEKSLVVGKIKSYNKKTNVDVFGNGGPSTNDHIWPTQRNGTNLQENIQLLASSSNLAKADALRGKINGIRFCVEAVAADANGKTIGKMYVLLESGWHEVVAER